MKKIMFVCTGNTCRSPMAEALFKKMINERGLDSEIIVWSAGIYAFEGDGASPHAIEVMKNEYSIDIRKHRARVLSSQDVDDADIILVMTRHHKEMIEEVYPDSHKVNLLKEYAGKGRASDVIDPFGQDYNTYKSCAIELEEYIAEAIDKIRENL